MPTFELVCSAHGEVENTKISCPYGCPRSFVRQEIRTAPAFRRSGAMRFVDQQLTAIAKENGLSDMRVDPKDGRSVAEREQRRRELETQKVEKQTGLSMRRQHWAQVQHAKPGFARDPKINVPTVNASQFGTKPSAAADFYKSPPPPPRPVFIGTPKE